MRLVQKGVIDTNTYASDDGKNYNDSNQHNAPTPPMIPLNNSLF